MIFKIFINKYLANKYIKQYRKKNSHNETYPANNFRLDKLSVGKSTYGEIYILDHSNEDTTVSVGHFCSIAPGVKFILGSDHPLHFLSSYPFKVKTNLQEYEAISKGSIIIQDDVWIGTNSIILSGVQVSQGAIVAAGSVVSKDVPPYAVVGGIPAKIIKYRFSKKIIARLLQIDYSKFSLDQIKNNIDYWYMHVDETTIDELLKKIEN